MRIPIFQNRDKYTYFDGSLQGYNVFVYAKIEIDSKRLIAVVRCNKCNCRYYAEDISVKFEEITDLRYSKRKNSLKS